jgi:hypothetical protein
MPRRWKPTIFEREVRLKRGANRAVDKARQAKDRWRIYTGLRPPRQRLVFDHIALLVMVVFDGKIAWVHIEQSLHEADHRPAVSWRRVSVQPIENRRFCRHGFIAADPAKAFTVG